MEVHPYDAAMGMVRSLADQGKRVWIDRDRVTFAFSNVVPKDRCVIQPNERSERSSNTRIVK